MEPRAYHVVMPLSIGLLASNFPLNNKSSKDSISYQPGMVLLSLGIDLVPPSFRGVVTHILLAACPALVRQWKDPKYMRNIPDDPNTCHLRNTFFLVYG